MICSLNNFRLLSYLKLELAESIAGNLLDGVRSIGEEEEFVILRPLLCQVYKFNYRSKWSLFESLFKNSSSWSTTYLEERCELILLVFLCILIFIDTGSAFEEKGFTYSMAPYQSGLPFKEFLRLSKLLTAADDFREISLREGRFDSGLSTFKF